MRKIKRDIAKKKSESGKDIERRKCERDRETGR